MDSSPLIGAAKAGDLPEAVWTLETAKDLSDLVEAWA